MMRSKFIILFLAAAFGSRQANAQAGHEWHVSKTGHDTGAGNAKDPFLTIQYAADKTQPGDKVIIHEGVYREQVLLAKGGGSEDSRIVFMAAPGEIVTVKGSEQVTSWKKETGNVWRTDLSGTLKDGAGPFDLRVNGDSSSHLGEVYVDGVAYEEQTTQNAVNKRPQSWFADKRNNGISILVNFGSNSPARKLVELNKRAFAFQPSKAGVNYITIDRINISQVASGRASMDGEQPAAISTGGGTHWVIQNSVITDIKCVAISLSQPGGRDLSRDNANRPAFGEFEDINAVGKHIIRNNLIRRCGQAGIFGMLHGTRSEIYDNQIEDIKGIDGIANADIGAVQLAVAVDVIVRGNLIRNITNGNGIRLGPLYQGARITQNIITDIKGNALYFLRSHGLALIDNNVVVGPGVATGKGVSLRSAEANVFAHNLFIDCVVSSEPLPARNAYGTINYRPHSLVTKQTIPATTLDNKWFRNIFIRGGLDSIRYDHGEADHNIYLAGAQKTSWGDQHSKTMAGNNGFRLVCTDRIAKIDFDLSKLPALQAPLIDTGFIGRFALSQSIESPDGAPIRLSSDFFGNSLIDHPGVAGPFARYPGNNTKTGLVFERQLRKEENK